MDKKRITMYIDFIILFIKIMMLLITFFFSKNLEHLYIWNILLKLSEDLKTIQETVWYETKKQQLLNDLHMQL